jgi:heme-degrading monooxygenase HmoA
MVYARITTFEAQTGKLPEALEVLEQEIAPAVRAQPGYEGMTVFSDPATSKGMVITYWSSEADIAALEARGFWESQVARGIFLIAAVPQRQTFDVALRE